MDSVVNVTTYTYVGMVPRNERLAHPDALLTPEVAASNVFQLPLRTSFTVEGEPEIDEVCALPAYTETVTTVYVAGRPRDMSIHRRYHRREPQQE